MSVRLSVCPHFAVGILYHVDFDLYLVDLEDTAGVADYTVQDIEFK